MKFYFAIIVGLSLNFNKVQCYGDLYQSKPQQTEQSQIKRQRRRFGGGISKLQDNDNCKFDANKEQNTSQKDSHLNKKECKSQKNRRLREQEKSKTNQSNAQKKETKERKGLRRNNQRQEKRQRRFNKNRIGFVRPWQVSAQVLGAAQSTTTINFSPTVTNIIDTGSSQIVNSELTISNPTTIIASNPINIDISAPITAPVIIPIKNIYNIYLTPKFINKVNGKIVGRGNGNSLFVPEKVRADPKCKFNTSQLLKIFKNASNSIPDLALNGKKIPQNEFIKILETSDVFIDGKEANPGYFLNALNGEGEGDGINFDINGFEQMGMGLNKFADISVGSTNS